MNKIIFSEQPIQQQITRSIGEIYREDGSAHVLMLTLVSADKHVCLMHLSHGSPRHPVHQVKDFHAITENEWKLITANNPHLFYEVTEPFTIIPNQNDH